MNRGSAFKWIELLKYNSFNFNDGWGLKYTYTRGKVQGKLTQVPSYSPCGILEEFVCGELSNLYWTEIEFLNKDNTSPLLVSKQTLDKVKAKTDLSSVDDFYMKIYYKCGKQVAILEAIKFIESEYELL